MNKQHACRDWSDGEYLRLVGIVTISVFLAVVIAVTDPGRPGATGVREIAVAFVMIGCIAAIIGQAFLLARARGFLSQKGNGTASTNDATKS